MCDTRTYIFQGFVQPDMTHRFELYSATSSQVEGCDKDPRLQDDECAWPFWEDIWEHRGSLLGRVFFRIVCVPAHWSEQEMRDSIPWWGEKQPWEVAP